MSSRRHRREAGDLPRPRGRGEADHHEREIRPANDESPIGIADVVAVFRSDFRPVHRCLLSQRNPDDGDGPPLESVVDLGELPERDSCHVLSPWLTVQKDLTLFFAFCQPCFFSQFQVHSTPYYRTCMLPSSLTKHLAKLQQKKYRKEFGEFIVEGIKGVEEAIAADAEILAVIVDGARREEKEIADLVLKLEQKNISVSFCGRKDIGDIKTTDTFPGIQAIVAARDVSLIDLDLSKPILFLDQISDPGNLGTIIRTADWFGVSNLVLSDGSVDLYNPKVVRSTMGSLFHITVFESHNALATLEHLKEKGYRIVGLDTKGKPIRSSSSATPGKPAKKQVYIFGSESHGIRKEIISLLNETIAIPGQGRAESLNVGVAVGVVLFHIV